MHSSTFIAMTQAERQHSWSVPQRPQLKLVPWHVWNQSVLWPPQKLPTSPLATKLYRIQRLLASHSMTLALTVPPLKKMLATLCNCTYRRRQKIPTLKLWWLVQHRLLHCLHAMLLMQSLTLLARPHTKLTTPLATAPLISTSRLVSLQEHPQAIAQLNFQKPKHLVSLPPLQQKFPVQLAKAMPN